MNATCTLCGAVLHVSTAAMLLNPGMAEISQFDLLAGRIKLYAMTQAESADDAEKEVSDRIALCQLCGVTVIGKPQAELHDIDPESDNGKIANYDALAALMWKHISDFHPDQTAEGIMQQRRAAKMYAMNWATIDPELDEVRQQREAIN